MSDDRPPLATIAAARETLQGVERSAVGDDTASHILNALEELDNAILNASSDELARMCGAADCDAEREGADAD